jgi:NtrC-family two-component system sensor histidine kinase KinB
MSDADRTSLELLIKISRELALALDLPAVLDRILVLSIQNIGVSSGSIIVLDEQGQPIESAFSMGGKTFDRGRLQLRLTFESGLAGWVARNRQAALVPDTSQDPRWFRRPDDEIGQTGPKAVVSVPIMSRESLVGVLTLVHPTPGFLTSDHLSLVQAIADQAGVAIINARLYTESQRRVRVLTAITESAAVINASLKLEEVLNRILEQTVQALRVGVASLALINPQSHELVFMASTDKSDHSVLGIRVAVGQGLAGWVAEHGVGVVVPDAYQDPRFYPDVDRRLSFRTSAVACAPIRSDGQVIGILELLNPLDQTFDPDALQVLNGICSLAGTAIRHAQLFDHLEAAHQRYRELFEEIIDPIVITDRQGKILEVNRQAEIALNLDGDESRIRPIQDYFRMEDQKLVAGFEKLSSNATISYASVLNSGSGCAIPVQVYARNVQIEGVSHLQWIFHDISERTKLDRLRDDLSSMIYHDLRSPLANIVSSLDVLSSQLHLPQGSSLQSLLNIAARSTERIQRLTDSLLDINRLEAGQPVLNRQPAPPLLLANDAVDAVYPIARTKNIQVITDVSNDIPDVFVDADMIRRVLVNLAENAVKFAPPGGKIYIGARLEGEGVQFWVEDTGPGIPADEKEHIFDKFTRLTPERGPRGLGLGLAFCRLAVTGHGGRIWVESLPGCGARFYFTLPVAVENIAVAGS